MCKEETALVNEKEILIFFYHISMHYVTMKKFFLRKELELL